MIVPATRTTPKPKELIRVLKQDFSDQYSYKLFGLGPQPTVIVSKSWFTGAQITIQKDEIRVEETVPSVVIAFLSTLLMYALGFGVPYGSWREKLQKQLAIFLKRKYN